jgi:DNA-binding transcriptional ArsR family regulator
VSVEAISWALTQPVSGTDKVVLIGIANHLGRDEEGWSGWVYTSVLVEYAQVDERTVRRSISRLVDAGLMSREERAGGTDGKVNPRYRPNRYSIRPPSEQDRGGTDVPPQSTPDAHVPSGGDAHVPSGGDAHVPSLIEEPSFEPSTEPTPTPSLTLGEFEAFWQAYPRRIARPAALKAWKRARRRGSDATTIIGGAERWAAYWTTTGTETRFVPHPATWLNQHRWNDNTDPTTSPAGPATDPTPPACGCRFVKGTGWARCPTWDPDLAGHADAS